jgi:hypothetical protein
MADAYIQVYPDATGKKIDTSEVTVGANTVERQRLVIASDSGATNLAGVTAKGSQGSFALAVQRLSDSGRAYWSFSWDAVAGVTAEALVSGVANLAGTAAGAATSYTVSTGKTLRITGISVDATGTAAGNIKLMFRGAPSGIAITSALWFRCQVGIAATTNFDHKEFGFPEGIELAPTTMFAVSQLASVTTLNSTVTVSGYEY